MMIPMGQTWKGEEGEQRLALAKELWAKGESASVIARQINMKWCGRVVVSRNAVIGALHRYGSPTVPRMKSPPRSRKRNAEAKSPPARMSRNRGGRGKRTLMEIELDKSRDQKREIGGPIQPRRKVADGMPKMSVAEAEARINSGPPPLLINLLTDDLKRNQCHVVVQGTTLYCGLKAWKDHPYCENHSRLIYNIYRKTEAA